MPSRLLKILLAEDNPVNQYMAVVLLEERGHTVKVANNGQEVLNLLATDSFDLILMDVQMPVMDGFQATEAIRAKEQGSPQHMRIIAMTAHALKGDRERCLAAGMDDYIAKPVQENELLAMVENEHSPEPEQATEEAQMLPLETAPALDWQEALTRVRGRQKLLCKMMSLFQQQSTQLLADMGEAIQMQDAELLRHSSHTLKSSANSIGAFELGKIAQQLETIGQEAVFNQAEANYCLLQQESTRLAPAIAHYLNEHQE
jgi:CheY-like chemotaxis protein